jgi:hypothetical protein
MGSSSFYAVESAWFTVRAVARELVSFSLAASRANEPERVAPSVRRGFFEISIRGELVEPTRATSVVIGPIGVDSAADAEQGGARLPNTGTVTFSHAQNQDSSEHPTHQEDRANAPQ